MKTFLDKTSTQKSTVSFGNRRLFVLIFSLALLWQVVGFIQIQLTQYHRGLVKDFKVIAVVSGVQDNAALNTLGESLNSKTDVHTVKLFSPQDGLAALRSQNPRLVQALVSLGREQMPAYFELRLHARALNNIGSFTQNLAAEYPQLSIKYSQELAKMAFYSGLCLRVINIVALSALMLLLIFMFTVEAYPSRGVSHGIGAVWVALLAGGLSFVVLAALVYPTGLLMPALSHFTTAYHQVGLLIGCGLLGWTLGKWKKF